MEDIRNHLLHRSELSFVSCCRHAFKHFGLCACAAAQELTRFYETGNLLSLIFVQEKAVLGVIHAQMPPFFVECMK